MDINALLNFYHDAYQHEYRTEKVANFFAKAVTHRSYPTTFKLLSQPGYQLPVDTNWGRETAAELALTSSERKLVAGAFFIKGKDKLLGRNRKIFAPLLLLDAHLTEYDGAYLLETDPATVNVNPAAIDFLNAHGGGEGLPQGAADEQLLHPDGPFSFAGLHHLQTRLSEHYPSLVTDSLTERLAHDERLHDLARIAQSRSDKHHLYLLPDTIVGIVDKPAKSKGIINELRALADSSVPDNSLLRTVFGLSGERSGFRTDGPPARRSIVPVSLSEAQEGVLQQAHRQPLSLVIGPPGTGKSFTIAALAIQLAHLGRKVLIASKNEQACRVIYDKINEDIGVKGVALDASRARFRGTVAAKLRNITLGVGIRRYEPSVLRTEHRAVNDLHDEVDDLGAAAQEQGTVEKQWGERLVAGNSGLFHQLRTRWIAYRAGRRRPVWEIFREIGEKTALLRTRERRLIKMAYQDRVSRLLYGNRQAITDLEQAYRQEHGNVAKEIFSKTDYDLVLGALPIWICKSSAIHDVLPLRAELFDVVIIDEASQCDIASSLPLLYRARSGVVVGDPHQLRHVSFLSRAREAAIREKHGLSGADVAFKDRSILDQVNRTLRGQHQVSFLDEHYRSMPDIIDFSNRRFYEGELKVMTANPRTTAIRHLFFHRVAGRRSDRGENEIEAGAILTAVRELIDRESGQEDKTGIGVLSPIRAQVNLLQRLLRERLTPGEIKAHRILVGTPFSFQGEERDHVYLSFVADADTHPAVFRYLERPDVFNVSITRACRQQHVYTSVDARALPPDSLLAAYLTAEYTPPGSGDAAGGSYDAFIGEVLELLADRTDLEIHQNRVLSGCLVDLLVVTPDRVRAIDLVGYPGPFTEQLSPAGIRRLERVDVSVFVLPYSAWRFQRETAERALLAFLPSP